MFDLCPQVTISKCEYERLVRESERMNLIRRNLNENKYFSMGDLKLIVGEMKNEGKENDK